MSKCEYEYIGFTYVVEHAGGIVKTITPAPNQHYAAARQRHLTAARECFETDAKRRPGRN
jgi:hypothetical protein